MNPPTDPVSGSFNFAYDDTLPDGLHFLKPSSVSLTIDGVDYGIPANANNTNIRMEIDNSELGFVTFYFADLALHMGANDFKLDLDFPSASGLNGMSYTSLNYDQSSFSTGNAQVVPIPASLPLLLSGLMGISLVARRRSRSRK
jgi:hypothetical protein